LLSVSIGALLEAATIRPVAAIAKRGVNRESKQEPRVNHLDSYPQANASGSFVAGTIMDATTSKQLPWRHA